MRTPNKVLVVADDITGADDIGTMYYKSGHSVRLYPFSALDQAEFGGGSKLVVDTDSRFVTPDIAYRRVYDLVERFSKDDSIRYINKQCSVFRGNIGAEFDAMLDVLGLSFAPVVLGFPDNGRTTLEGIHFVHGTPLENSQFQFDPVNPMHESSLAKILSRQTQRPVTNIFWHAYDQGEAHLRRLLEERRAAGGYVILDVRNNDDLALLARVLKNEKVICGSSAIAYYLGLEEGGRPVGTSECTDPVSGCRAICIAGSLTPQTDNQINYAAAHGVPVLELHTETLFDEHRCQTEFRRIFDQYAVQKVHSPLVILRTEKSRKKTLQEAEKQGISAVQAATAISGALSELLFQLASKERINNIIVCGGDTSGAFTRRFGIGGMQIGPEIEPGVSLCASLRQPWLHFVLKSGSFGSEAFLQKAYRALSQWEGVQNV